MKTLISTTFDHFSDRGFRILDFDGLSSLQDSIILNLIFIPSSTLIHRIYIITHTSVSSATPNRMYLISLFLFSHHYLPSSSLFVRHHYHPSSSLTLSSRRFLSSLHYHHSSNPLRDTHLDRVKRIMHISGYSCLSKSPTNFLPTNHQSSWYSILNLSVYNILPLILGSDTILYLQLYLPSHKYTNYTFVCSHHYILCIFSCHLRFLISSIIFVPSFTLITTLFNASILHHRIIPKTSQIQTIHSVSIWSYPLLEIISLQTGSNSLLLFYIILDPQIG